MDYEIPKNDRYSFIPNDFINEKYIVEKKLGYGSYSDVYQAYIGKYPTIKYALKINRKSNYIKKSAHNEIELLKKLKHPNILRLQEEFEHNNYTILVFHAYKKNLYEHIKREIYISHYDTCNILLKITSGLEYLKKLNIIHRDLKPENILMTNNNENIVIADFGMSINKKLINEDRHGFHVQTIYYRAPEIFFKTEYDESIDIWSLGCIAYEIYWKKPLFKKKNSDKLFIEQNMILGPPPMSIINNNPYIHYLYDDIENPSFIKYYGSHYLMGNKGTFRQNHYSNKHLIDFILECCKWVPSERCSPTQALKFLKQIQ